ncbi:MAG: hypothetical protein JJE40_02180, partial [Vicinamibacteria bacterium]|nr:hypothetical protein [Vicinamibacteria bacterium]
DIDLRPAAIWLCAALMAPSFLWTARQIFRFTITIKLMGYDGLEMASWFDKSLLLTLSMVNGGVVTLLCWEALLVDRRDALILGSLPVSWRLVVAAKAAALVRLFGLVAALNLPSILLFSVLAYSPFGAALVARSLLAHGLAVAAASTSTCLLLTAALVTVTSLFEGRWLRVITVVVQASVLVGLTGLILGAQWLSAVIGSARAADPDRLGWMALWPPAWFLGLFQVILGAPQGRPVFEALAMPAVAMSIVAVCVCAPVTLLLWRRELRVLVSAAPGETPSRWWSMARHLSAWLARQPMDRALIQFFVVVLWRSPRHRLAVLTAFGLVAAVTLEGTLALTSRVQGTSRWLTEYAVPVLALLCLLAVFRWLLTLPAELPASWALGLVTPARGAVVRRAVGRVLLVVAVAPPALVACTLSWWQGDMRSALAHGALTLLAGLGLVEYALTRVTFMPFATEYLPGRSNLKARWPIHVSVLLFAVPAVAQVERALVAAPGVPFVVTTALGIAGVGYAMHRRRRATDVVIADPGTGVEWTPVELRIGWA